MSITKLHVQCVACSGIESVVATAYCLVKRQALEHNKHPQIKHEHASSHRMSVDVGGLVEEYNLQHLVGLSIR
uniref:Secreted protein n=1 Tax=Heterorhabditis bacteriophora TaxID=37862 RepID=A0A1I7WCD1_HETBA